MLSLRDGTFLCSFSKPVEVVKHFNCCGHLIQTFNIPPPPPKNSDHEWPDYTVNRSSPGSLVQLSNYTFAVLYIYRRSTSEYFWQVSNRLAVFDIASGSLLSDIPFGDVTRVISLKNEVDALVTLDSKSMSLWNVVDGKRLEFICSTRKNCFNHMATIRELQNGLLVITKQSIASTFNLSSWRIAHIGGTEVQLVKVHREFQTWTGGCGFMNLDEVSPNIVVIKIDRDSVYRFWDMSDLSRDPQLVYTIADGIDRGPMIRINCYQNYSTGIAGNASSILLLFDKTLEVWDWETKTFISKPLRSKLKEKLSSSSEGPKLIELTNGTIVVHKEDSKDSQSVVLWRFPNR